MKNLLKYKSFILHILVGPLVVSVIAYVNLRNIGFAYTLTFRHIFFPALIGALGATLFYFVKQKNKKAIILERIKSWQV